MKRRSLLTALPAAALLAACGGKPPPEPLFHKRVHTFGSWVDISFYQVPEPKAQALARRLEHELSYMNDAWHAWKPGVVEDVNRQLRTGQPFWPPPEILPLLAQSRRLYEQTEGLFNPAMGLLIRRWGFHSDRPWDEHPPPPAEELAALVRHLPGMNDIEFSGGKLVGHNDQISLDFGGYAKGYGLDQLARILSEAGVSHALVSATSNIVALGTHGPRPWRIAIRHPRQDGAILAWLDLADGERVSSSGDYERYFEHAGRRYHHIIDPRTGYPSTGAQAVTLIHRDGAVADAGSTALMVAGPRDFARIAARLGVSATLMVDAQGQVLVTPGMRERLHFPEGSQPVVREVKL